MRRLFGTDGVLYKIMTMLLELAEMNVLFLFCCIPVITAGAGTVALYNGLIGMHKRGEGAFSVREFFRTVQTNLKCTILPWNISLAVMAALIYGMMFWVAAIPGVPGKCMGAVYLIFFIMVNGMLQFLFMLLALGAKWKRELVKDAFLLALAKFPVIILTVLMSYSFLVLLSMPMGAILRLLPLILLFWIASPGYVCTGIFMKILEPLYRELFEEEDMQVEENENV